MVLCGSGWCAVCIVGFVGTEVSLFLAFFLCSAAFLCWPAFVVFSGLVFCIFLCLFGLWFRGWVLLAPSWSIAGFSMEIQGHWKTEAMAVVFLYQGGLVFLCCLFLAFFWPLLFVFFAAFPPDHVACFIN